MITSLPPMTSQEKRALVRVIAPFAPTHGVQNRANLEQTSRSVTTGSRVELPCLSTFFHHLPEVDRTHHY